MNKPKHSKAPWTYEEEADYGRNIRSGKKWLATALSDHRGGEKNPLPGHFPKDSEECLANARLIAAAPLLLEACKLIIDSPDGRIDPRGQQLAREAIKEAT